MCPMKILVFSDSHSYKGFMEDCIAAIKPESVIHLGDHFDDTQELISRYSHIRFHQVCGNCDRYRAPLNTPTFLCYTIGGVKFYMTHGHLHNVKFQTDRLIYAAKEMEADAVLFGHTHKAVCVREWDMWVINPGACNHRNGTACYMEIAEGKISACRIIGQADLEEFL